MCKQTQYMPDNQYNLPPLLHNTAYRVTEMWCFLLVVSVVIFWRNAHQIHKQKLVKLKFYAT